jgi:hypothetical protein
MKCTILSVTPDDNISVRSVLIFCMRLRIGVALTTTVYVLLLYTALAAPAYALTFPFGSGDARGVCSAMASCNDFSFCADRRSAGHNSSATKREMGSLDERLDFPHTLDSSDHDG